ncbi:uncharacterized protein LOC141906288 [Tubulanus polymorphus]|uniref:uncharacterized protein LOC141906288 n=1 Tax=Tubulanus polymorphus TaxID=672921 RepID=UPI003DA582DC
MTASFEDSYREIDRYLQEAQNELGLAFDDLPADLPPWPDPPDVTKPDPVISESKDTRPKHAVDFEAIFRAHNLIDSNRSMRKKTSSSSGSGGGHHVKRKDENLFGSSSKHSSSKRHHRSRCMSDAGVKTHEQRNNSASSVDASKYRISLNLDFSPRRERIQSAPESRRPENAPDKRKTSADVKLSQPDIQGSYSSVKPDLISDCDKIYPEASSPPPSGCGRVKNSDSTTTLFRNRDFPQEKETRAYEKVLFDDDDDNDDRAAKKKNSSRRRKKSEKVEDHRHPSRKPDISAVFDFIETQIRRNICKDDMGSECEPFLQMEDKNVYAAMSDAADRNSSYQQRASDSDYDEVYAGGDDDLDENDRKVVNNSNDAAHEKMKQHNHVDVLSSPLKHPHDDIKFIDEDDDDDEVKDEASESVDAEFAQKVKSEIEKVTVVPDVELRRKTSEPTIDWLALRQKRLSPIFDCEHSDIDSQHYYCIKVNEDNLRKADEKGKKYGHRRSGSLNVDTRANSNVRSKGDCIDDFDVFLSRKTISALETLNKGDNKEPENGVRTEQPQQHAKKKERRHRWYR